MLDFKYNKIIGLVLFLFLLSAWGSSNSPRELQNKIKAQVPGGWKIIIQPRKMFIEEKTRYVHCRLSVIFRDKMTPEQLAEYKVKQAKSFPQPLIPNYHSGKFSISVSKLLDLKEEAIAQTPSPKQWRQVVKNNCNRMEKKITDLFESYVGKSSNKNRVRAANQFQQDFFSHRKTNYVNINAKSLARKAYFRNIYYRAEKDWDPYHFLEKEDLDALGEAKELTSVLGLTINARGDIKRVVLIRSSGLKKYDKESVKVMKAIDSLGHAPEIVLKKGKAHLAMVFTVYL